MIAHLRTSALAISLAIAAHAQVTNQQVPRDNQKGRWINYNVEAVMPIVWAPDGSRFYVANQHGSHVVVYTPNLGLLANIPVGPGIASMALHPNGNELWCVDRVTSSVTVIDIGGSNPLVVTHTIPVGAEPQGIAFTPTGDRAYVTCSAVDRVDIIESATYAVANSIQIPVRKPHAIVRVGGAIYVAPHLSGNGTAPIGAPGSGGAQPAITVRHTDEFPGTNPLPDRDLIVIAITGSAATDNYIPSRTVESIGTILQNAHVRPGTSEIWIPHTEALNGVHTGERDFIGGQVVRNRIAIFDPVNPTPPAYIDMDAIAPSIEHRCTPPTGIAFGAGGQYAYVAGYGSNNVSVLDIAAEPATWVGTIQILQHRITPSVGNSPEQDGAGPRVPSISPDGQTMIIVNTGEGSITKVDIGALPLQTPGFTFPTSRARSMGWDPLPREIIQGRLDFARTRNSASQTSSCESCHVGGHTDGLAWDLSGFLDEEGTPRDLIHLPLDHKGPMITQTSRRLREVGPWHWRGEKKSLMDFDSAFVGLLERISPSSGETASLGIQFNYTQRYMDTIAWPANHLMDASREYTPEQLEGADLFMNKPVQNGQACVDCHALPLGTAGEIVENTVGGLSPTTVVPSLRGVAEKLRSPLHVVGGDFGERTELGTGLGHSGDEASWLTHLLAQPGGTQRFNLSAAEAIKIVSFLEAFDTGIAPAAATQVTMNATNASAVLNGELSYLMAQAQLGNCDLVYHAGPGTVNNTPVYFSGLYDPARNDFGQASASLPRLDAFALMNQALMGTPITFVGMPLWSGYPAALDQDNDRLLDLDEIQIGTDPEFWDSDGDLMPDGYEAQHGTNPLSATSVPNDNQAPTLVGAPNVIFTTQNTIKFEFETSELSKILVSYNGGYPVLRAPVFPFYDKQFSIVLNMLEPSTQYNILIEMEDPSGNISQVVLNQTTSSPVRPAPVFIDNVSLQAISTNGPQLRAQVQLARHGGLQVTQGYDVHAAVYRIPMFGIPHVLTTDTVSTLTSPTGQVNFTVPVPSTFSLRGGGLYYFVVHTIDVPPGEAVYVEADDVESVGIVAY